MTGSTYDPTTATMVEDLARAVVHDTTRWPSFRDIALQARTETSDQVVASIGPFATWRLSAFEDENLDLDVKDVNDIAIKFTGGNRGFEMARQLRAMRNAYMGMPFSSSFRERNEKEDGIEESKC